MREIKFRAWNEVMEKMFTWNDFLNTNMKNTFIAPESTAMILMQFTGLHDKNRKEIYEGDIVDVTRPCIYETGTIIFKNGCFFIKVKETLLALWECEPNNYQLEVIGNIYENSNLLKGADNIE